MAINGSSPEPLESATELGPPNTVAEEVVETVMQVDLRYTQKKHHRTTESKVKIIEGQWVLRNIRGENE